MGRCKHEYIWDGAHEYDCRNCGKPQDLCVAEDRVAELETAIQKFCDNQSNYTYAKLKALLPRDKNK